MLVNDPRQPEVPDLEHEVLRADEDVGRLQVPVQHVGRVDVLEPSEQLVHEQLRVLLRQRALLQQARQVRLHVLLDDVGHAELEQLALQVSALGPQHLVHLHDVVVVQAADDLDLPEGMLHASGVTQDNLLDGHLPAGPAVHGRQHQPVDAKAQGLEVNKASTKVIPIDTGNAVPLLSHRRLSGKGPPGRWRGGQRWPSPGEQLSQHTSFCRVPELRVAFSRGEVTATSPLEIGVASVHAC